MSRKPGPDSFDPRSPLLPTRTAGPLGFVAQLGDTPGSLGVNDLAALLATGRFGTLTHAATRYIQSKLKAFETRELTSALNEANEIIKSLEKLTEHSWPKVPTDVADLEGDWNKMWEDWLLERGGGKTSDAPTKFDKNSPYSHDIAKSYGMKEVIAKWCSDGGRIPWEGTFVFSGPGTATGNYGLVEWFLGSYQVKNVQSVGRGNTVLFKVINESHWHSGTRLPASWRKLIKSKTGQEIEDLVTDAPQGLVIKSKLEQRFGVKIPDRIKLPSFGGNWWQEFTVEMEWHCQ